jgi:hypothetical protein
MQFQFKNLEDIQLLAHLSKTACEKVNGVPKHKHEHGETKDTCPVCLEHDRKFTEAWEAEENRLGRRLFPRSKKA